MSGGSKNLKRNEKHEGQGQRHHGLVRENQAEMFTYQTYTYAKYLKM